MPVTIMMCVTVMVVMVTPIPVIIVVMARPRRRAVTIVAHMPALGRRAAIVGGGMRRQRNLYVAVLEVFTAMIRGTRERQSAKSDNKNCQRRGACPELRFGMSLHVRRPLPNGY